MSRLIAIFETPEALVSTAHKLKAEGFSIQDFFSPFPLEGAEEVLGLSPSPLRKYMAIAGFGAAAMAYALEWYSAVIAYPYDSGGRPFNSWPVFLLVPFEVGVLAAGITGFLTFLMRCGFPRLHDPIFELRNIERATQDRFFLVAGSDDSEKDRLRKLLESENALSIEEAPP